MTSTTASVSRRHLPVRVEVLDQAVAAVAAQEAAAVALLVAAAEWADAHVVTDPFDAAGWGDRSIYSHIDGAEGVSLLAGPGAPMVKRPRFSAALIRVAALL